MCKVRGWILHNTDRNNFEDSNYMVRIEPKSDSIIYKVHRKNHTRWLRNIYTQISLCAQEIAQTNLGRCILY